MGAAFTAMLKPWLFTLKVSAATVGTGLALSFVSNKCLFFIGKDEQLRVEGRTGREITNGPGMKVLLPLTYRSTKIINAVTLGTNDYVKLKDSDGQERIERGPKQLFLDAYDEIVEEGKGMSLSNTEYVLIHDKSTGEERVKKGPCMWVPEAQEVGTKGAGGILSSTEYVLVENKRSGEKRVEKGPQVWFPAEPSEKGAKHSAISLSSTEYVLITNKRTGEKRVTKGPDVWFPTADETGKLGAGISLSKTDYVLVENKLSGNKSIKKGPCVWFPEAQEAGQQGSAVSLGEQDYIFVTDKRTGTKKMVNGPDMWFPEPYDEASSVMSAHALQDDEYMKLIDMATGERWVMKGKALVFLEPSWKIEKTESKDSGIRKAWVLKAYEYVRLIDSVTGQVTMHEGEATVFPGPNEDAFDKDKRTAIDLAVNQYMKVLDQTSGNIRVVHGPVQAMLGPHEMVIDNKKRTAVEVDAEHAVLVRDKSTGQVRLVTESQLFIPGAHESIEHIRELIKLADHEAIIVKDEKGFFKYFYGSESRRNADQPRSFFLQPYNEIVELCWSKGRRREKRELFIKRLDLRAQYMSFEFNCRTKDNVELVLEGTFFWQVDDLPLMVQTTGDTTGDICKQASSQFNKHLAQCTLKEFMDDINVISNKVYQEDNSFYSSRGLKVHALEVTRYQCAEESTSVVLQQIIQETTNRMNRLSQAGSEKEVKIYRMTGQIEQEKLNGELLEIQHKHSKDEAKMQGEAEADRISAFFNGLGKDVPRLEDRMAMWDTLRKTDALSVVAQGGASLYYTPNDVNLSIEGTTSYTPQLKAKKEKA